MDYKAKFGTDGKTGTLEIVKRYEKDISTIVIEADDSVYDAMNKEIDLKTATFIDYFWRKTMDYIKVSQNIYEHLADDISCDIYSNRLRYNMTGDKKYLNEIINNISAVK